MQHADDFSTKQLAKHLGVSEWLLKKWRRVGEGPKWYRVPGTHLVRYEASAVDRWKSLDVRVKRQKKAIKIDTTETIEIPQI